MKWKPPIKQVAMDRFFLLDSVRHISSYYNFCEMQKEKGQQLSWPSMDYDFLWIIIITDKAGQNSQKSRKKPHTNPAGILCLIPSKNSRQVLPVYTFDPEIRDIKPLQEAAILTQRLVRAVSPMHRTPILTGAIVHDIQFAVNIKSCDPVWAPSSCVFNKD